MITIASRDNFKREKGLWDFFKLKKKGGGGCIKKPKTTLIQNAVNCASCSVLARVDADVAKRKDEEIFIRVLVRAPKKEQ